MHIPIDLPPRAEGPRWIFPLSPAAAVPAAEAITFVVGSPTQSPERVRHSSHRPRKLEREPNEDSPALLGARP